MLNDTIGSLVMKKNNECFDDTLPPQCYKNHWYWTIKLGTKLYSHFFK